MEKIRGISKRLKKRPWHKPKLVRLGNFATFVQTGGSKSGPEIEGSGGGGGEEPMMATGGP
jgi:hypothetical protein